MANNMQQLQLSCPNRISVGWLQWQITRGVLYSCSNSRSIEIQNVPVASSTCWVNLLRLKTWSVSIKWNYQHVHHQLEVVNKTYSNHWKILDLSLTWPTKTSEACPTLGSWLIFERITDQRNQTKTPVASSHGALASRTQCTQRHGAGQGRIGAQTFRGPKDWKDRWSKHTTGQVFFAKA